MKSKIAIVGVGPRGVSVVERLGAYAPQGEIEVHLIDDAQIGAGRIWLTTQTKTLCMNTLAGAVTLFTEPGASVTAPVRVGPSMYEWIQLLRGESLNTEDAGPDAAAKAAVFAAHPLELDPSFEAEIAASRPESNPSRALYGEYIRWVYTVARAWLPDNITVVEHTARALSLEAQQGYDVLTLSDGSQVQAQATILATGWQKPALTAGEQALASAKGRWIGPDNPVEQKVSAIPEKGSVLVRGLGMGFFDLMALLTLDRGGVFVEDSSTRSGLRYVPSGREPHLYVTSGRGYPYLPKSDYKSLPPKAALPRLRAVIAELAAGADPIDFEVQVWPAIVRDAYEAYYRVLLEQKPWAVTDATTLFAVIDRSQPAEMDSALAPLVPDSSDRFSLAEWEYPLAGFSGTIAELTVHIGQGMARDIGEAVSARSSALKAGLWSISASRKPASILGAQGRYTWESRRDRFNSFMALGQMVGSGPPLFRTRQLLALVDAGLVSFLGARPQVSVEGEGFAVSTASVSETVRADTLVDAWMHSPTVLAPADPLALSLAERVRPFAERDAQGQEVLTGSPEVNPASSALVGPDGKDDPRLYLIGIPTYAQLADTTISPMPGTNPLFLQETDRVAGSLLQALGEKISVSAGI